MYVLPICPISHFGQNTANNEELIRICMQVKELINIRDRCMNGIFKSGKCNDIIEFLCTDWVFSFHYGSKSAILFWIRAVQLWRIKNFKQTNKDEATAIIY